VAISSVLYIIAAFTLYTYDYYIFNDCTMTAGQLWLSHSYTMIVIFKCYTIVEIPSFLYIFIVFTIFTYDYCNCKKDQQLNFSHTIVAF
jgi:hypothetical protein